MSPLVKFNLQLLINAFSPDDLISNGAKLWSTGKTVKLNGSCNPVISPEGIKLAFHWTVRSVAHAFVSPRT